MLHSTAQNEIKSLKDKVAMLEKRLASSRSIRSEMKNANRDSSTRYGGIVGSAVYQAIIEDHQNDGSCVSQNLFDDNVTRSLSNGIYIHQPSISFNEQQPQYNQLKVVQRQQQLNHLKENNLPLSYMTSKRR